MNECPKCQSDCVNVERDICTGWMLEADRFICYECGYTWIENEHSMSDLND